MLGATGLLGALIGTAGIIGVGLGFALKSTGENYFASILLSLRQPFDPHDLVKIDDQDGRVVRLSSRATVLLDFDGNHVRIPNSKVFNATIINYTRNPERRFWFKLEVLAAAGWIDQRQTDWFKASSPDDPLVQQVDQERASAAGPDLLRKAGRPE